MRLFRSYGFDPQFRMKPKYMSPAAMSEMYSGRPVVCSDVVLYQKEPVGIYLAQRILKPGEGLWVIGGSRRAGESAADAAVRRVNIETGLTVPAERFRFLGIAEFIWPYRAEPPQDEGRHDVNYVFGLEVDDDEVRYAAAHLDPVEYDTGAGLRRFGTIDELKSAGVKANILDYFQELFG